MDANVNAVEYNANSLMTFLTMYVLGILFISSHSASGDV